jgi:exonuclease III
MKMSSCLGDRIQAIYWRILTIWAVFGISLDMGNRGVLRAFLGEVSGKRGLIWAWIRGGGDGFLIIIFRSIQGRQSTTCIKTAMKILTWNINHRIHPKKIPRTMAESLASLSPDFIVLTEYVQGQSHAQFLDDLKSQGYPHVILSPFKTRQNRILIASRSPLKAGALQGPTDIIEAVPCNVLHVVEESSGINVLGLRMPLPMNSTQKKAWWDWITKIALENKDNPFIITGDFNTDPEKSPGPNGSIRFDKLNETGWTFDLPKSFSWWWNNKDEFGWKLDHTFLNSRHFTHPHSEYLTESGPYIFARKNTAMSDHAVLLVEANFKSE